MTRIQLPSPNSESVVRFIKLGRSGRWESECIRDGIARLGFATHLHLETCLRHDWEELRRSYEQNEPDKSKSAMTSQVNQVRAFFEDDGSGLWITFHLRQMWWTRLDTNFPAELHPDGDGTFRRTLGWSPYDASGKPLNMDKLSGNLTKVAGYQGTICEVTDPTYVLRRINAIQVPAVVEAHRLSTELQAAIIPLMRLLTPQDFELLVDLVFSSSGWRRVGSVGGTQKLVDLELILPTTGERAFVQVKSQTNQREFEDEYLAAFTAMSEVHRLFFVYHSGVVEHVGAGVTVIGPERLAEMVIDTGMVSWLVEKAS